METYMETTRANSPPELHVTPVHEFSLGKQGSPLQSEGGLFKFLANSSIAEAVER